MDGKLTAGQILLIKEWIDQGAPWDTVPGGKQSRPPERSPLASLEEMPIPPFLRSYAKVGYREKDNPQFRYEYLDDMIGTIGRGILGLTVNCARCHNHKFDPISQKDYYQMRASLFGYVESDYPLASKEQAGAHEKKRAEIDARIAPLRQQIRQIDEPYRGRLALRHTSPAIKMLVSFCITTP